MEEPRRLPNANHLSVIAVVILLIYSISPFLRFPQNALQIQLPGLFIPLRVDFQLVISIFVSLLAAAGMDWLLSEHPLRDQRVHLPHWMLPALAAWGIGIPLFSLPISPAWWGVFLLGAVLLVLVFTGEYICFDPDDHREPAAAVTLIALSFALFSLVPISLRAIGARLYIVLPAVMSVGFLVTIRTLYLRSNSGWQPAWGIGIAILTGQAAVGLHYLPLSAIQYGILLLGLLYALISLSSTILRHTWRKQDLWEPSAALLVSILLAAILG